MRRVPYIALRAEERAAIERCREIADGTIRDISSTAPSNQMSGWNGVWLVFQAVLVPLLGLFLNDQTVVDARASTEACQTQVEIAMMVLARMQPWSPTAKRTLDVVSRIYEASKRGPDMVSDASGVSSTGYPVDGQGGFPGLIPGSFADNSLPIEAALPQAYLEDPLNHMWDYLSWSDNSLWPGLSDFEGTGDLMPLNLGVPEKTPGENNSASANLFEMQDSSSKYYVNPSMSFY